MEKIACRREARRDRARMKSKEGRKKKKNKEGEEKVIGGGEGYHRDNTRRKLRWF